LAHPGSSEVTSSLPLRLIWSGSFLAAVAAHAALILPWIWRDSDALAGAAGQQLDVISVVMAEPGVLESREVDRTLPVAPASAAPVELKEGTSTTEQQETKKAEPEKKPEEVQTADAILEVKPETPKQTEDRKSNVEGGEAARGDATVERKASAPVAASAGVAREYARLVARVLATKKPKGIGARGTVNIKFTIAETGRLSSTEVSKSSGDKRLDQKALDAVQQAVFPVPPPGMSILQLTYEIPYQFR